MNHVNIQEMVLAVYPTTRGFAFVLFEGPESPFDWGVKETRNGPKNLRTLEEVSDLIERYQPEVLVIEDTSLRGSRRSGRIRRLYRGLASLAANNHMEVHRFSKKAVKAHFSGVGASTKYEIAQAIAARIPAFTHRLPRLRKIWMSEDSRQGLFDAAALGLVFFGERKDARTSDIA